MLPVLDLEPVVAAAWPVDALAMLGDQTLQPHPARSLEQPRADLALLERPASPCLISHDLLGEAVPTSPDHALQFRCLDAVLAVFRQMSISAVATCSSCGKRMTMIMATRPQAAMNRRPPEKLPVASLIQPMA